MSGNDELRALVDAVDAYHGHVDAGMDATAQRSEIFRAIAALAPASGGEGREAVRTMYAPADKIAEAFARPSVRVGAVMAYTHRDEAMRRTEPVQIIGTTASPLAATPTPQAAGVSDEDAPFLTAPLPVPVEIMEARAQGRAEALAILLQQSAEDFEHEYIGSHSIGATGDYGAHWIEDKLRELFRADDSAWSLLQATEGEYWHNRGLREQAERDYKASLTAAGPAPEGLEVVRIPKPDRLDPITVYLADEGGGRGRMTIVCYNEAWTCYWGGMGDRSLREFVAGCNAGYVSGNMLSGRSANKREREYAARIAAAVIAALAAPPPAAPQEGA